MASATAELMPVKTTYGDKYGPAMMMTDQREADEYFARCVDHQMRAMADAGKPCTKELAEQIERSNLGYWAGYFNEETRQRVERLFRCAHPIFGAASGA